MKKTIFLTIFLFIFQSSFCFADEGVKQYVDSLVSKVSTMLSESISEEQKISKARSILSDNLDFDWMATQVLGRQSSELSSDQKASFVNAYKEYMIKSYSSLVRKYNGQKATIKNVASAGNDQYLVQTTVEKNGQNPIRADYIVRKCGSNYKIGDIKTEGISLIATHASEFGNMLKNQGFDSLLKAVQSK